MAWPIPTVVFNAPAYCPRPSRLFLWFETSNISHLIVGARALRPQPSSTHTCRSFFLYFPFLPPPRFLSSSSFLSGGPFISLLSVNPSDLLLLVACLDILDSNRIHPRVHPSETLCLGLLPGYFDFLRLITARRRVPTGHTNSGER